MFRALATLLLLLVMASHAGAQTMEEIDRRDAAVVEAWLATPLTVRKAFFVAQHPDGFGEYVERADSTFKRGEKLVTYAEPVGYAWKDVGNGQYEFGFDVDFLLKTPDGKVLAGQEHFAHLAQRSYARNREFMVLLTLDVESAPPGSYIVEYTIRDVASPKTASFSLPFKIAD